jgi:hypothetical protein
MLTAPALTFVFLCVVVGLGTALVWMFWEFEQAAMRRRETQRAKRLNEWRQSR